MSQDKITAEEIDIATQLLKKIEPGLLPLPIFFEIARLYVSCIIEIVPLYNDTGTVQVLLQDRKLDDHFWAGRPHAAGTVLRANDEEGSFQSAINRILHKELQGITVTNEPTFVTTLFHQVDRGRELALVFYVELATKEVAHLGRLYDIDKLPEQIVETQIGFIKTAAEHFQKKHITSPNSKVKSQKSKLKFKN